MKLNQREFLKLCTYGTQEEIEEAINNGASINRRATFKGASIPPLFVAVMERNFDAVKVLMRHKAKAIHGFIAAIIINNKSIAKFLISLGANINCHDVHKRTPLLCAVTANKPEAVKWLINLGADVNKKVGAGFNALTYAAFMYDDSDVQKPDPEIIQILMHAGSDYKEAMLAAIRMNNVELVSLLVKNGADVNEKCAFDQSPLTVAIFNLRNGINIEIIKFLVSNGADVNEILDIGDGIFTTNLNVSISMKAPNVMELLLGYGADPNFRDAKGRTALMYAVLTGDSTLRILLEYGADPNIQDNDGRTALMLAVLDGESEEGVIKSLLEHGADPNIQDKTGLTALMWAIIDRDRSPELFISALIRTGGLHAENGALWFATAVFFAAARREAQLDIVKFLINNGANLEIRDKKGMNAYAHAILNGDDEITEILNSSRS